MVVYDIRDLRGEMASVRQHLLPALEASPDGFKICPYVFWQPWKPWYHSIDIHALESPHFKGIDERTIVFQCGDFSQTIPALKKGIVFQESLREPTAHALHYCPDWIERPALPIKHCPIRASFQGHAQLPLRAKMVDVLSRDGRSLIVVNDKWWDTSHRASYEQLIHLSQFVLCPAGYAANTIRFFETIRCKRIPVLIADDVLLPLADRINYDKMMVRVPEDEVHLALDYIDRFSDEHDVRDASDYAEWVYDRYFRKEAIADFFAATLIRTKFL